MTFKKILVIFIILSLFVLPASYAALNSGLQAPSEFEHSIYWEKNNFMDIYSLKTDNNTRLEIEIYSDELNDLFKDDAEFNYYVTPLGDNIFMGIDNDAHEGYVLEVIEHDGQKYLVNTYLANNPSNDQIKDSLKYITEFNKLNNVKPIPL